MLEVRIDSGYSQHLALLRSGTAEYPILLGPLAEGAHRLELRRDAARSAPDAGAVTIDSVEVRIVRAGTTDYEWIARAPLLRARPGTVERFSDVVPLVMNAERDTR